MTTAPTTPAAPDEKDPKAPARLSWGLLPLAREAAARWPILQGARLRHFTEGENVTWRATTPDGARYALRLYRPGRWDDEAIRAEHLLMGALSQEVAGIPAPIPAADGHTLQVLGGGGRSALFPWSPGRSLHKTLKPRHVRQVGALLAHMHAAARKLPPGLPRPSWTPETTLGEALRLTRAHWDAWITGDPHELDALVERTWRRWERLAPPTALMHADLHFGNLLYPVNQPDALPFPIDFDDCGLGPLPLDLAVPACHLTARPHLWPDLLGGYNALAQDPCDREALLTFMIVRHVQMIGWLFERTEILTPTDLRRILVNNRNHARRVEALLQAPNLGL
jgi:Ser/Thr protein kinase RdoA (MazF antagonist)